MHVTWDPPSYSQGQEAVVKSISPLQLMAPSNQLNIFSWETESEWGKSAFHELSSLKLILAAEIIGSKCQAPYFFMSPNFQCRFPHPPENQRGRQMPGKWGLSLPSSPTVSKPVMVSFHAKEANQVHSKQKPLRLRFVLQTTHHPLAHRKFSSRRMCIER